MGTGRGGSIVEGEPEARRGRKKQFAISRTRKKGGEPTRAWVSAKERYGNWGKKKYLKFRKEKKF